ncbi:MAG: glycosyltransferase [Alphaproteobacteria bacterium]|nr:glycosyltransferase [Alphaproteobacteria bacterium]
MFVLALKIGLSIIIGLILTYTVRHYVFTINRLFGHQRHPYINIDTAQWPSVTVLVAAHNEEAVIAHSLEALLEVHYPRDRLKILVVNDRSTDGTREIVDSFAARYPGLIIPFHRTEGAAGKAPALKDATETVTSDIIIVFDADYIPGRGLIKQLSAPFFDPEVGLVMGRVVPLNTGKNLLTRLLDLERAGGYQVDQQARMNMGLVPQYGGTVGGIRMKALESVGGWLDDTLAEDTDLTYRAILSGWKSVYQNRSECYEEVPETWPVRMRQITRWTRGHNQSMCRYTFSTLFSKNINMHEKFDGLLLLGVYMMSPIIIVGWAFALFLFYIGDNNLITTPLAMLTVACFGTVGNFAAFFEIGSAVYLDRGGNRIRLLPFNFLNFLISAVTVSLATVTQLVNRDGTCNIWEKTPRFRKPQTHVRAA